MRPIREKIWHACPPDQDVNRGPELVGKSIEIGLRYFALVGPEQPERWAVRLQPTVVVEECEAESLVLICSCDGVATETTIRSERVARNQDPGMSTVSITWITPFDVMMSVFSTFALFTDTPPSETFIVRLPPSTVLTLVSLTTSAAVTLPDTT